jgi:hypothetical protein
MSMQNVKNDKEEDVFLPYLVLMEGYNLEDCHFLVEGSRCPGDF